MNNSNRKRFLDIDTEDCTGPGKAPFFPPLKVDDHNSLNKPTLLKPKSNHNFNSSNNNSCQRVKEHDFLTLSPSAPAQSTVLAESNNLNYPVELDKCRLKIKQLNKILDDVINALVASNRENSNLKALIKETMPKRLSTAREKAGLDAAVSDKIKKDMGLL